MKKTVQGTLCHRMEPERGIYYIKYQTCLLILPEAQRKLRMLPTKSKVDFKLDA